MSLSEKLKTWRDTAKISQAEAARRLGVPVSTYQKWEYATRIPSKVILNYIDGVIGRVDLAETATHLPG